MSGTVERLFGHMTTDTRHKIADLLRKEAATALGHRPSSAECEEGEGWDYLRRKAAQYMAVAKWFEDQ